MQFIKATDPDTNREILINIKDISVMIEQQLYTEVWLISDPEAKVNITEKPSIALEQLVYVDPEGL